MHSTQAINRHKKESRQGEQTLTYINVHVLSHNKIYMYMSKYILHGVPDMLYIFPTEELSGNCVAPP